VGYPRSAALTRLLQLPRHPCSARVLIAEDERRLADAIARGLRREGMAVDLAPDGTDALVKARVVRYDVLILDRDLPGVHGDDVCRTLRDERPETGILMLTAAGTLDDLSACGSSSASSTTSAPSSSTTSSARYEARLNLAKCFRAHGINVPDPSPGAGAAGAGAAAARQVR
jgi:CheY-like chemotaxis protein